MRLNNTCQEPATYIAEHILTRTDQVISGSHIALVQQFFYQLADLILSGSNGICQCCLIGIIDLLEIFFRKFYLLNYKLLIQSLKALGIFIFKLVLNNFINLLRLKRPTRKLSMPVLSRLTYVSFEKLYEQSFWTLQCYSKAA